MISEFNRHLLFVSDSFRVCLATQAFHMPLHSSYHSVYASFPGLTDTKFQKLPRQHLGRHRIKLQNNAHSGNTHIIYELASAQKGSNCRPSVQVIPSYLEHTKTTHILRTTVPRCILLWSAWVGSKCATRSRFLCTWRKYLCSSMVSNNCRSGVVRWWGW